MCVRVFLKTVTDHALLGPVGVTRDATLHNPGQRISLATLPASLGGVDRDGRRAGIAELREGVRVVKGSDARRVGDDETEEALRNEWIRTETKGYQSVSVPQQDAN